MTIFKLNDSGKEAVQIWLENNLKNSEPLQGDSRISYLERWYFHIERQAKIRGEPSIRTGLSPDSTRCGAEVDLYLRPPNFDTEQAYILNDAGRLKIVDWVLAGWAGETNGRAWIRRIDEAYEVAEASATEHGGAYGVIPIPDDAYVLGCAEPLKLDSAFFERS